VWAIQDGRTHVELALGMPDGRTRMIARLAAPSGDQIADLQLASDGAHLGASVIGVVPDATDGGQTQYSVTTYSGTLSTPLVQVAGLGCYYVPSLFTPVAVDADRVATLDCQAAGADADHDQRLRGRAPRRDNRAGGRMGRLVVWKLSGDLGRALHDGRDSGGL
jgi:hypothetical protein